MHLSELAIFTDDVDEVAAFYERLLGAAPVQRGEGIALFRLGDVAVLIHRRVETAPGKPPCEDHMAFAAADVDAAVNKLQARGLSLEIPPDDYDWGRSAYLRDPDGRLVEVHQRRSS